MAHVGEVFAKQITLTEKEIREFATLCGDQNPLHHDAAYAANTRFGRIIASGPHYSSLLVALVATHFSQSSPMLGLEFNLKFLRPVYAGVALIMAWKVVGVERKDSLGGDLVSIAGSVTDPNGAPLLTGEGKVLLTEKL
ncbi:MAG: MaoC family dehydratase [Burkholderiales bacterium]